MPSWRVPLDRAHSTTLSRESWRAGLALAAVLLGSLAGPGAEANDKPAPATRLTLPEVADLNPDPRILEVAIEARVATVEIEPGRRIEAWTYNGGLPGPLIRLRLGDRLIVRFTNRLPQPTTIHWHGLRVPNDMDGVPGVSQPEVRPGESFTYDFPVLDAGLYWYHPHVMSAAQVGFGLYGALLVDDFAEDERVGVPDEQVLVLSDVALEADGRLEAPDSGGSIGMVFGREGGVVLVNGRKLPALRMRAGGRQRWRIVNAAKSRYFNLYLGGQRFFVIGGDGGLLEYPVEHDLLLLAPGERADVLVTPQGKPGEALVLQSRLHNRGYGSVEFREEPDLVAITLDTLSPLTPPPLPALRREIAAMTASGALPVTIELTLAQKSPTEYEYGINGVPFSEGRPLNATIGRTYIWTLKNTTKWSHPFHLHGFFFQVLDAEGQPVRPLAWKDTVDVPLEQSVRVLVRFDERPGAWMYHCHILDHADGGLMGMLELNEPGVPPRPPARVHRH
jgi:FtsP/CotA-like multicopper oxidase with cupredoxin domain